MGVLVLKGSVCTWLLKGIGDATLIGLFIILIYCMLCPKHTHD